MLRRGMRRSAPEIRGFREQVCAHLCVRIPSRTAIAVRTSTRKKMYAYVCFQNPQISGAELRIPSLSIPQAMPKQKPLTPKIRIQEVEKLSSRQPLSNATHPHKDPPTHKCTCMHAHVCTRVHVCVWASTHTRARTYACTSTHTHTCMHVHARVRTNAHPCAHAQARASTESPPLFSPTPKSKSFPSHDFFNGGRGVFGIKLVHEWFFSFRN
jgi:hypothetical protein